MFWWLLRLQWDLWGRLLGPLFYGLFWCLLWWLFWPNLRGEKWQLDYLRYKRG
ncbi:hypothetical protein AB2K85_000763 [Escherichia coli]